MTIEAGDDYVGMVFGRRTTLEIERLRCTEPDGARLRRWAEVNAQGLLAGGVAEHQFKQRRNNIGASSDHEKAFAIAWVVNEGSDETAAKWLDWQLAVTENKVAGAWHLIERGAALLEHRTLSRPEFRNLVYLLPNSDASERCQVSVPARHSGSGSSTTLPRGFGWQR
ncbi:MAG: hypothetical protein ABR609_07525 [Acidimicrobiia bacterium]